MKEYNPSLTTRVYANDGRMIGEFFIERRVVVPLSAMPEHLIQAFLSAEDAKFFSHEGLDYSSIFRAFYKNLKARRITQGASTITQQVAKNFFLSSERKFSRKIREAVMAYRIEKHFTKDEILHLYLNHIYFGNGSYGVQAASKTYFGKDVSEVTVAEAALLAGLPKAPSRYSPYANLEGALKRQGFVVSRMLEEGYITKEEALFAKEEPIILMPKKPGNLWVGPYFTEHVRRRIEEEYGQNVLYRGGLEIYTTLDIRLQQLANDAVRHGLISHDKRQGYRGPKATLIGEESIWAFIEENSKVLKKVPARKGEVYSGVITDISPGRSPLTVDIGGITGRIRSRDIKWTELYNPTGYHDQAQKIPLLSNFHVGDIIDVTATRLPAAEGGEGRFNLYQEPIAQASFLAMDPATGHVLAMVGGYDFSKSEYNRAIQAHRQPGSAFKPFIYTAAIDKGYTTATIVIDSPLIFEEEVEETELTEEDLQLKSVEEEEGAPADGEEEPPEPLIQKWKPRNFGEKFHGPTTIRQALTKSRNVVTIKVLRDIGVSRAVNYAQKMGIKSPLARDLSLALGSSSVTLLELTNAYATLANLGRRPEPVFITRTTDKDGNVIGEKGPKSEEVISPATAYIMTSLLKGVVDSGTGWRARALKRPSAGKTGTTNNLNDAWYLGFTPDLVAGAWIGYDEERPLGNHETGSRAAAPIWVRFMKGAIKGTPARNFPIPEGVEFAKIDPASGLLATSDTAEPLFEVFKVGTKPRAMSPPKIPRSQGDFLMLDAEKPLEAPEQESEEWLPGESDGALPETGPFEENEKMPPERYPLEGLPALP